MGQEAQKKFPLTSKDYELYEEVGEGVSATVYRAICIPLKEIVAIKVLDLEKCNTDLDGIRREVQTMILIDHPNVLRVHCSFTAGRNLWVVMPFMAVGSCLHIMKTAYQDGFEEPVIATLLFDVLKALAYLHAHGHIHRDVKAGNILIDSKGVVKLADFGVSVGMFDGGDRRARNTFVGTPCWMAPEVMQQLHGYDFKADIWSFGITALELAHGHAPFSKYPPMKVLLMTLQNAPPGLDYERDKRFSKAFKEMVAACLVKDPKKRPSSEKLLKHPFFKYARSSDYLSQSILDGLPPLGERFRMLKAKEADFLVRNKTLYEDKEHLSQQEYIRGISAWNFNLDDLKSRATLIQDDPIDNSDDSRVSKMHKDGQDSVSSTLEMLHSYQGDHDNAAFLMEDDISNITDLESSLASFPIKPLLALKGCFDMNEDDACSPSSKDSTRSDPEQERLQQTVAIPLDKELGREYNGDHGQTGPLFTVGSSESPRSLLPQESALACEKFIGDGEKRDYLQPRLPSERNFYGPMQFRLKKEFSSPTLGEDVSEGSVVKYRGRFKVTSTDVSPKGAASRGYFGGSTSQTFSSPSATSLLPSLQYLLQQNTMQKESIIKLMKLLEQTSGYSNEFLEGGTNDLSQMIPHVRERELQNRVIKLQQSIGNLEEELQKLKAKNTQLERKLIASANDAPARRG